jgi:hypothetical protein
MKRLFSLALVAASAGVGLMVAAGPASAAIYSNCTQAKAAGHTNIPRTSPFYSSNLDSDHDGIACETSGGSSSSSSSSSSSTSGGGSGSISVNTGSGGTADRTSPAVPAAVGGLGVVVLGGSAVAMRRRTTVRE